MVANSRVRLATLTRRRDVLWKDALNKFARNALNMVDDIIFLIEKKNSNKLVFIL